MPPIYAARKKTPYLAAALCGLIASAMLLMASFWWGTQADGVWLGRAAFGPGDDLFPYVRRMGLLSAGEAHHHLFVLLASWLVWALIFGLVMGWVLSRRKDRAARH
jgi:hypothetical protein